ncbi:MAG: hypothetical protein ABGY72_05100 [bacterium]
MPTPLVARIVGAALVAMLSTSAQLTSQTPEVEQEAAPPPHVARGNDVEATYKPYVERLRRYQARLRRHFDADAPDLAASLTQEPPTAIAYGYLIVPRLSLAEPVSPVAPWSAGYNWPWTSQMLDTKQAELASAEQSLDSVETLDETARRAVYEQLVAGYAGLEQGQRQVDQHLKHNRFWQQIIADDRGRFERQTVLHDAVVERQRLRVALEAGGLTPAATTEHVRRIAELGIQVEEGQPPPSPPSFVEIVENSTSRRVLRVPLYTDIPDAEFVTGAVAAIQSAWSLDVDNVAYRLELDLRTMTAEDLYAPDPPPVRGAKIDLNHHVQRFPSDGGVLTTGANRTHAIPGRYIAIGPDSISNRVVAHEFGHILGFTDRYLRGARELGRAGFGIIEIIPDGLDLMAAPGSGLVRASHFHTVIEALNGTAP